MATPPISEDEARERIELVEQCLREGHPPKGQIGKSGRRGSIGEANFRAGRPAGSAYNWYRSAARTLGREADWSLYLKPEPEGRGSFDTDSPDGFHMRGRSTLYNSKGDVVAEWVKTSRDQERQEVMIREAVQAMTEDLPRAKPTKGPSMIENHDLLACYNVSDHHFGMLSWGEETGEDYDLDIAEKLLVGAFDHLVKAVPPCGQALITIFGDLFHTDSYRSETPDNKNQLDSDGRYPKLVRVAVRCTRYLVAEAKKRHSDVRVILSRGNHDPTSIIFLMEALSNIYEHEPRVTIDTSPGKFHYHRFGNNMIGVHHGDTVKGKDLPLVMAHDKAEDWGQTEHRFWWTGHVHHDATQEYPGVMVESFRVLAAKDAWHTEKGYRSARDMKAIILHREHGEVGRHIFNPAMLDVA